MRLRPRAQNQGEGRARLAEKCLPHAKLLPRTGEWLLKCEAQRLHKRCHLRRERHHQQRQYRLLSEY